MVEAWRFLYEEAPGGHDAFKTLLGDKSDYVRLWVAAQLLTEGDPNAVQVLEIVRIGGLLSLDAEITPREWRHGRLVPFGKIP